MELEFVKFVFFEIKFSNFSC